MGIISGIEEQGKLVKYIFNKFKRKDFSGDSGQAVKNSTYQLVQNLIAKVGSLIFTIVLARILAPERMGLYSLALSTIMVMAVLSDLGIGPTLITFVSKSIGKKSFSKAGGYVNYFLKWKIRLTLISMGILAASAYFIANYYYRKPIFFAILAGVIYLPMTGFLTFIEQVFKASNDFKRPVIKETVLQLMRFLAAPVSALILISFNLSNEKIIFGVILTIVLSYSIALIYLLVKSRSTLNFLKYPSRNLTKLEIKEIISFILPLSTMVLSGTFFGYIDTLMLGHYVSEIFIAYYGAAFALMNSVIAIIGFIASGTMPIFARRSGAALENIFKRSRGLIFATSLFSGVITFFFANFIIKIIYGQEYFPSGMMLKIFAILIVITAITTIYKNYFIAKGKTNVIMWLLIVSTLINVVLNTLFITFGILNYGELGGVYGAVAATMISRIFYLLGFIILKNRVK